MQTDAIKTLVWAIKRVLAYVKIRDASVGGSNSKIALKKDSKDQSPRHYVYGKKEVGRIGTTYKYGEY